VKKYCLDDVKITKEVFDYAEKHGKLIFKEDGKKIDIPLPDAKKWAEPRENVAMTFSMPF
jgi:hypothetical protein